MARKIIFEILLTLAPCNSSYLKGINYCGIHFCGFDVEYLLATFCENLGNYTHYLNVYNF